MEMKETMGEGEEGREIIKLPVYMWEWIHSKADNSNMSPSSFIHRFIKEHKDEEDYHEKETARAEREEKQQ